MRFSISRESLLRPLQLLNGVIERKQTLPVLSNILIVATEEGLSLHATDLELGMVLKLSLEGGQPGEATLPARKLMDITRALPEQAGIEISAEGGRGMIRSGNSRFALSTLPAEDFPRSESVMEGTMLSLPRKDLRQLLTRTHFAMAQQDVRYYLNGMLLEISGDRLRAVATDGHRLALSDVSAAISLPEPSQIILPRKAVGELMRLLDDSDEPMQVRISEHHAQFVIEDMVLTSKLIDGRFPDYARVIPEKADKALYADRELFHQALVRVAILTNEQSRAVRVQLRADTMRLSTHNPEQEEAEEEFPVEYRQDEMEIGFNVAYLLDALNAIEDDRILMRFSDPNSSCLLRSQSSESCKYVVMPMRI